MVSGKGNGVVLYFEQVVQCWYFVFQFGGVEMFDDVVVFYYVEVVGEWCGEVEILFDYYDCVVVCFQCDDYLCECLDDYWCEVFGDFVEQQQVCVGV